MKKVLDFGKVDYNGSGRKNCRVTVEVELRNQGNGTELSICGSIWNPRETDIYSGGQNIEELAELLHTPRMHRIYEVWRDWHLNGMNAGTPAQTAIIAAARPGFASYPASDYDQCLAVLDAAGLLYDPALDRDNGEGKPRGYRYGTEWLSRTLPEEIIAEVMAW